MSPPWRPDALLASTGGAGGKAFEDKKRPAARVPPLSRFRDLLPLRHWRPARQLASGFTASECVSICAWDRGPQGRRRHEKSACTREGGDAARPLLLTPEAYHCERVHRVQRPMHSARARTRGDCVLAIRGATGDRSNTSVSVRFATTFAEGEATMCCPRSSDQGLCND